MAPPKKKITKKNRVFRFFDSDYKKWQKIARKNHVPLTTLIERVMDNHSNDPHLFI